MLTVARYVEPSIASLVRSSSAMSLAESPTNSLCDLDALALALVPNLHSREQIRIVEDIGSGVFSWDDLRGGRLPPSCRYRERLRERLRALPTREAAWAVARELDQSSIRFLERNDSRFPKRLGQIPDPPSHLFAKGTDAERLGEPCGPRVGIVGSRAASRPGLEMAERLAAELAYAGCVIVSGLARGIDGAAHRGALDAGGRSWGVLGSGVDVVYPRENRRIFDQILDQGAVLSEFPPGTPPMPLHFPRRNRILAGLADVLVVVEGTDRSGARSTVDHALDQGKEVLTVPRDLIHRGSKLPNRLLSEGARPVLSARDVLEAVTSGSFDVLPEGRTSAADRESLPAGLSALPEPARSVVAHLSRGSATSEELHAHLSRPSTSTESADRTSAPVLVSSLSAALVELEIQGWIVELPGGAYRLARRGLTK